MKLNDAENNDRPTPLGWVALTLFVVFIIGFALVSPSMLGPN